MKRVLAFACAAAACGLSQAVVISTIDTGTIATFQSGISVFDFESVPTRTPAAITSYTQGDALDAASFVFDQIPGAQFSVGGMVGTNMPALFELGGGLAGDAQSGDTVLGPVSFEFTTNFGPGAFIEVFFPVKVSKVGFWLNPSLGDVLLVAADTNFAFSGLPETTLESGNVTAGQFVGIERASADIGGFKIIGGASAFTVDDFSFGATTGTPPIPEPGTWALLLTGLAALGMRLSRRTSGT